MNSEQRAKIDSEVLRCLEQCRGADRPPTCVADFVDRLKADPGWTNDEIIELQTRVITAMFYRPGQFGPAAAVAAEAPFWTAVRRFSTFGILLLTIIALALLAIFLGGNLALRNQFRGLRDMRQDAVRILQTPQPYPGAPRPGPAPLPATPVEPAP